MLRLIAASLTVTCALAWVPNQAAACGPPLSDVNSIHPSSGTHPANTAIRISGFSLDIEALTVTVDGVAAQLVAATGPVANLDDYVLTINPEPGEGQEIHLSGMVCTEGDNCAVDVTYTTSAADVVAPVAAEDLTVNLHEYPNIETQDGACFTGSDFTYWLSYTLPVDDDAYAQIAVYPESSPDTVLMTKTTGSGSPSLRGYDSTFESYDPKAICVRVTTFDLSNNLGPEVEACGLCNFREDMPDVGEFQNPPQPEWTSDDIVAGGMCGEAVETGTETDGETDGETAGPGTDTDAESESESSTDSDGDSGLDADKGCGCRSSDPTPEAWLFAALVALGLRRRRT